MSFYLASRISDESKHELMNDLRNMRVNDASTVDFSYACGTLTMLHNGVSIVDSDYWGSCPVTNGTVEDTALIEFYLNIAHVIWRIVSDGARSTRSCIFYEYDHGIEVSRDQDIIYVRLFDDFGKKEFRECIVEELWSFIHEFGRSCAAFAEDLRSLIGAYAIENDVMRTILAKLDDISAWCTQQVEARESEPGQ